MKNLTVDQVNIVLMLLAVAAAYVIPFELVLFSYAILGPAHYLTQISWMHERSYFTGQKMLWLPFSALCLLMALIGITAPDKLYDFSFVAVAIALSISLALLAAGGRKLQFFILAAAIAAFCALYAIAPKLALAIGILTPTVLHIYVFTGGFMLQGALKSKDKWGITAFAVFLFCGLIFLIVPPAERMLLPNFVEQNIPVFREIADYMVNLLSFGGTVNSISMLGFLSFAYTYHYLNWFSKVEIIKWHHVPKPRLTVIAFLYAFSVGLYTLNYAAGLVVLYTLSFLHVLLELPLNLITFRNIGAALLPKKPA